jgi:hypothetical protein
MGGQIESPVPQLRCFTVKSNRRRFDPELSIVTVLI